MLDADLKHEHVDDLFDHDSLRQENNRYHGTPGISEECRGHGFVPAFRDNDTGEVYPSRYADGRPAPFHVLEGLPDSVIIKRLADGTVESVKPGLQSGFVKSGIFYTRDQAIQCVTDDRSE
jgi:hypothetical protein